VQGACGLFVVNLTAFILWERRAAHPLLDYSLFRSPAFNYGNLANFLCLCYLAGHNFITPFYLMTVKGLPTERAGTVFSALFADLHGMGPLAGQLSKRVNPRILCTVALGVRGAGLLWIQSFSEWCRDAAGLWSILWGLALVMATFIPSNNNVVMGMAPPGKQGAVSGSFRMVGRVGMTVGVCLFQTIFALAALQTGSMHADALKSLDQGHLLSAFSTVYAVGGAMFAVAAISSFMARGPIGEQK
jgi:MFS family permease